MANASDDPSATEKRPYVKPEIVRVPLRPEEAVLGACKVMYVGGPVSGDCMTCSMPGS